MEEDTPSFLPRKWQRMARDDYFKLQQTHFLLEACPGAGKTKWALWIAKELLETGEIHRVVIVSPLKTVRRQWAEVAHKTFGLQIDERYRAGYGAAEPKGYHGVVVTYGGLLGGNAQVFAQHCADWPTLVILDEIHHCARQRGWGDAVLDAFSEAARILSLSGTPFRRQGVIPFVDYEPDPDEPDKDICRPDKRWTYAEELAERPSGVRRIEPSLWDGQIAWETDAGERYGPMLLSLKLEGEDGDRLTRARLRAALDPTKPYFQKLFGAAHEQLMALRESESEAGGLIIARNKAHARTIRTMLREQFGIDALIAVGSTDNREQKESEAVLKRFAHVKDAWLIAVKMASEGYDCPRLRVLVYATTQYTEWSVIQAIGRVIRGDDTAFVFAPADPRARELFGRIFEGFTVAKVVSPETEDEDGDDNGPTNGSPQSSEITTTSATATTVSHLIEGGHYTAEDLGALRSAAAKHGLRAAGDGPLAKLYCDWKVLNLDAEDLAALESREDGPIARVAVHITVRAQVHDLVTKVVEKRGSRHVFLCREIKRRWTSRNDATLAQLWEIRAWLRAQLA